MNKEQELEMLNKMMNTPEVEGSDTVRVWGLSKFGIKPQVDLTIDNQYLRIHRADQVLVFDVPGKDTVAVVESINVEGHPISIRHSYPKGAITNVELRSRATQPYSPRRKIVQLLQPHSSSLTTEL